MPKDLRTFIDEVAAARPDDLLVVNREVDPVFELTGVLAKLEQSSQFPAVLFRKVKGSNFPVISNLTASYERLALSLGTTVHEMVPEFARRFAEPTPTRDIKSGPVKEVVWSGEEVDLGKLPLTVHNEFDAGKYISAGVMIVRDPDSGVLNAGIYRHQVQGARQLGLFTNPAFHGDHIRRKYEERNQPMEVVIAIGHHPALLMAAASRPPGIGKELEITGSLMGEPLEMTQASTVDLPVPARAEIIIEGIVPPGERQFEGTFGEWPRYYTGMGDRPYITVKAITMRRDAICQDLFAAHPEHNIVGALPRMGSLYVRIKECVPNLKAVNLPMSGGGVASCYISIAKKVEGEAKMAAFAAFSTHASIKHVYIVDDDIDVFNEPEVLWAMATRFEAHRDMAVIPNALGAWLIPTAYKLDTNLPGGVLNTKVIFDCTRPAPPAEFPKRALAPASVVEKIELDAYLEKYNENEQPRRHVS
jgi:2,5-furandicarboxylate decarboxylase 1